MMHIPSDEISQPRLHADTLGYTFEWHGHFLRGIYPQSIGLVQSYFDSGFLQEICDRRLFPKTWITDYENEQFGIILEHEKISPVMYATEWNWSMLKDAALMVLDIAQIGWEYGYNMVDCHKLNVMFKDCRPVYVDLGSFVPRKAGSTGWNPYMSFMQSYYYILKMWHDGMFVMSKRMMAPGVELSGREYALYEHKIYRVFPTLMILNEQLTMLVHRIAVWDNEKVSSSSLWVKILKPIINLLKISKSQRLNGLRKKIIGMKCVQVGSLRQDETMVKFLCSVINTKKISVQTATIIHNPFEKTVETLIRDTSILHIISIQENEKNSNFEYMMYHDKKMSCSCAYYKLLNNTVLAKGAYPEPRLKSEMAIIPQIDDLISGKSAFGMHNVVVLIEKCMKNTDRYILLGMNQYQKELVDQLSKNYEVEIFSENGEFESFSKEGEYSGMACAIVKKIDRKYIENDTK